MSKRSVVWFAIGLGIAVGAAVVARVIRRAQEDEQLPGEIAPGETAPAEMAVDARTNRTAVFQAGRT